jgi:hypothetical protein
MPSITQWLAAELPTAVKNGNHCIITNSHEIKSSEGGTMASNKFIMN